MGLLIGIILTLVGFATIGILPTAGIWVIIIIVDRLFLD